MNVNISVLLKECFLSQRRPATKVLAVFMKQQPGTTFSVVCKRKMYKSTLEIRAFPKTSSSWRMNCGWGKLIVIDLESVAKSTRKLMAFFLYLDGVQICENLNMDSPGRSIFQLPLIRECDV